MRRHDRKSPDRPHVRVQVLRTRSGVRLIQDGAVLSEILGAPGPTHDIFDLLAASIAMLAPGPRMAMLGFAGGGTIAPLRAMGWAHPIDAVDLSDLGVPLFEQMSRPWAGEVRFAKDEASRWLRRRRARYDLILEDLSVPGEEGVTKPPISFEVLPDLMKSHLVARGVVVTNALPVPGISWQGLLARMAAPHHEAHVIVLDEWENRILIAGRGLPGAAEVSRLLRRALRAIGSRLTSGFAVRRFRGPS